MRLGRDSIHGRGRAGGTDRGRGLPCPARLSGSRRDATAHRGLLTGVSHSCVHAAIWDGVRAGRICHANARQEGATHQAPRPSARRCQPGAAGAVLYQPPFILTRPPRPIIAFRGGPFSCALSSCAASFCLRLHQVPFAGFGAADIQIDLEGKTSKPVCSALRIAARGIPFPAAEMPSQWKCGSYSQR
jgi:hypothetical protein